MKPTKSGGTLRGAVAALGFSLLLSVTATTSGCGGKAPGMSAPASNATLASILVSPAASSLALGQSQQLTATGVFSDGSKQDLTPSVTWTSAQSSVATINAAGLAWGRQTGSTQLMATSGSGVTASSTITVTPAIVVSIAVSPPSVSLPSGEAQQLTAVATFSDGSQQNVTNAAAWSIAPSGVASVNTSGMLTAKASGTGAITAWLGSASGSNTLTVSAAVMMSISVSPPSASVPKGQAQQLTAVATFSDGSQQNITAAVVWSATPQSIATVSATGAVTAQAVGSATVTASTNSMSGSGALTVSPAVLTSIAIAPANASILLGATKQLASTGTFSDGTTQDLTKSATWSSANSTLVSISSVGLAAGNAVGTVVISANSNGQTGSTNLTVSPQFLLNYFSNNAAANPDATVQVTNVGTTGGPLCAMVYVFDSKQEMTECCGCSISQDGLRTFSVTNDLTGSPATGVIPQVGVIEIVPAQVGSNQSCDASNVTPGGQMSAWATHMQVEAATVAPTESPFDVTGLSTTQSSVLQGLCGFLMTNTKAMCTCGTGD
ncbi:MAG: Ig-like domain-containing protein [Candidatus Sulfotelmatobacter sp.]